MLRRCAADHVVMALGHSARDTFAMLHRTRRVAIASQAVLHRLSASSIRKGVIDKRALGPPRRPSAPGCGRLQAGAPRGQWTQRSTASACAPAARWWPPRQRAGPRGHQRHEPVLAQRTQCERGNRGGDRSERTIRRTKPRSCMHLPRSSVGDAFAQDPSDRLGQTRKVVHPLAGIVLQRQLESRRVHARRRHLRSTGPAASATSSPTKRIDRAFGSVHTVVQARRAPGRPA